jgi:hypothetical protein
MSLRKIAAELAAPGHLTANGRLCRACLDEPATSGHLCSAASLLVGGGGPNFWMGRGHLNSDPLWTPIP